MFVLNDFLTILPLRVGVTLMSSVFMTFGICSLLANIMMLNPTHPASWSVVITLSVYFIVTWAVAFVGAFKEARSNVTQSFFLWTIFIVLWVSLVILSMYSKGEQYLCLQRRCPESLWLYNSSWHENYGTVNLLTDDYDMLDDKDKKDEDYDDYYRMKRSIDNQLSNNLQWKPPKAQSVSLLSGRDPDADKERITIVLIAISLMSLFIYGWILLYSYVNELLCIEEDRSDDCEPMDYCPP